MRTTLTLDPDVAERLDRVSQRSGKGLDTTINEILRAGLEVAEKPVAPTPFRIRSFVDGVRPGIDPDKMNQLLDELDAEGFARTHRA
jgi:hypothetical protein